MTKALKSASVRKEAVDALQESEAKFHALAGITSSAVFIFQGRRFTYINPATVRLTGYSKQELLKCNFYDLFPAGRKKSMREWWMNVQRSEKPSQHHEFNILTKNGKERRVDLAATVIEFEGKPAALCTAFEIDEALRDSEERYRRLVEQSPEATIVRCGGEIVYINQAGVTLLGGQNVDEILGRRFMDFVHPDFKVIDQQRIKLTQEKSKIRTAINEKFLRLDGTPIDVEVTSIPMIFKTKPATQVVLHAVTERKRIEDALRESESHFRRRAEELSALYETTREIATQQDLMTLLQTIVDRAATLLNATGGSIYLRDGEHNELELRVAHGYQGFVGIKLMSGEGLPGEIMETLQPVVVDDYRKWENRSLKYDAVPITAVMAVPMVYNGELVGVLSINEIEVGDGAVRKYTSSEMEQLVFIAGAAASAVHHARLFEETKQHLVELELLYQASLSAAQIHSPRAVAQRIVDTLENLLNWSGSIWSIEDQHMLLLAVNTKGLTGQEVKARFERLAELTPSVEDGIVGWVSKNGRTVRTGKVQDDPHYIPEREEINSELCVPLKVGGKTIGCINVESATHDAFDEHDERLLTTLANQAAVAIENARLFDETRRRASRQVALNAIIHTSARTGTNLDEILNIALEQTLKALGLDMGAIWLSWSSHGIQRVVSRGIPSTINTLMTSASIGGNISLSRTLVINEWRNVKHPYAELFLSMGVHSTVMVPLLSEDKRIGGMAVCSPDPRMWTTDETVLVEAIGREVGLAAERARLFEETANRLKEMEAVNKISTALRLAQSLKEMLPQLVDETLQTLDTDTGGIWLFDTERRKLRQEIGRGWCLKAVHMELERGESFLGNVLTTEDVYFSSDVGTDPNAAQVLREFAPTGWSAVCVPIRNELEVIGVFMVSTPLPREFTGEDARLLITLTEIAGNAIHRMRLNEKLMQHAAELETRVTERTTELQTALQIAQAADRVKSEFVANINHELRTPLTNLVLYYQMLRAQPTIKTEERLDVIGRELQRLRSLIEDLLNLSRLDLGHVTFHPVLSDLNALVQTLVEDRQALARERGLTLRADLQADLEPVSLDESTMVQAVSNLLTNAMNYTLAGGDVLIKTLTGQEEGNSRVGFSVEDTGLGISAEDLPHLFERFYRGEAARQSGAPGTGLGLAIVKQVVDHHGGRIDVQNVSNGHGVRFTVWLPVKQPQETG